MAALPEDIEYGIQLRLINRKSFSLFQLLYLSQQGVVEALQKKWGLGITGLVKDLVDDYPYVRYTVEWKRYHRPDDAYYLALQDGQIEAADVIYDSVGNKSQFHRPFAVEYNKILNAVKAGFPEVLKYAMTHMNMDSKDYGEKWFAGYRGEILTVQMRDAKQILIPYITGAIEAGNVSLVRQFAISHLSRMDSEERREYAIRILTKPYNVEMYDIIFNELGLSLKHFMYEDDSPASSVAIEGDLNTIKRLISDGIEFDDISMFSAYGNSAKFMTVELLEWMASHFKRFKTWIKTNAITIATKVLDTKVIDYLVAHDYITYDMYVAKVIKRKKSFQKKPTILPSLLRHGIKDKSQSSLVVEIYKDMYPNLGDALLS